MRLNVPGHNANPEAAPELSAYFGHNILEIDVPPLLATIDKGENNPLEQSLELAAKAWGARRTWFLTNGASQANRIASLALAQFRSPKDVVLTQRSAHSSFIDGIVLGGIDPVFMMPTIDRTHGINHGISASTFAQSLHAHPNAKGAYVISPSYFGAVADVRALAELAHEAGMPLVVDGAWGSHFGFHERLPENPLALGADIMISSTHKLGGSLTQSAMIHLADGPYADQLEPLIDRAFGLTQSTSASALLLASLDIARAALVDGHDRIGASIDASDALRELVRQHPLLDVVSDGYNEYDDIYTSDPLHVSIDIQRLGRSGADVRELLMEKFGIYTEISTHTCIVAIIGPGHTADPTAIVSALEKLSVEHADTLAEPVMTATLPKPGKLKMLPREAYFAQRTLARSEEAIGKISADTLAAYPPGIPNILPGEVITQEIVDFLQSTARLPGGYVRGAADPLVQHLWICAD